MSKAPLTEAQQTKIKRILADVKTPASAIKIIVPVKHFFGKAVMHVAK